MLEPVPISRQALVLTAVTVCVMVNNYLWIQDSGLAAFWFDLNLNAQHALTQAANLRALRLADFLTLRDSVHGPICYYASASWLLALGPSLKNLFVSSSLWIPLYVAVIYGIGRHLYDANVGMWAAIYFLALPIFVSFSKLFPLEMTSHALTLLALLLLLRSDMLQRKWESYLFGLVLALGLMSKAEFVGIWFAPFLYVSLKVSLYTLRTPRERSAFLLATGGAAALVLWGYLEHARGLQYWCMDPRTYLLICGVFYSALLLLLMLREQLETRIGGDYAPLLNLLSVSAILFFMVAPFAMARNLSEIFEERVRSAGNGFMNGTPWISPGFYLDAMGTWLYHYLFFGMLLVGVACFFAWREYRDEKRLFFFAMAIYVFVLINVTSTKGYIYLFNMLGFSAVLATFWMARFPWRRVLLPVFFCSAYLQVFGWALVPAEVAGRPLATFSSAHTVPMPVALLPLLPDRPFLAENRLSAILHDMRDAAGGPFHLLVDQGIEKFSVYTRDGFRMVAMYEGIPMTAPLMMNQMIKPGTTLQTTVERGGPLYMVARRGHLTPRATVQAVRYFREWFGPGMQVDARFFKAYQVEDGETVSVFRILPRG